MEKLLTLQEASKYLRINRMTLYKMAWDGKVPAYRVGRQWRFKKSVLDRWLEESQKFRGSFQKNKIRKKKYVFLTGATGYLGSNLIPKFIENSYHLKLLVRAKKDDPRSRIIQCLSKIYNDASELSNAMEKIEVLKGDVTKKNFGLTDRTIQNLAGEISDVFHCAAAVSFDEEKKDVVRRNNIEGTKNILSFMEKLPDAHLHYMSTAYVCGQRTGIVKENELDVEQDFNNSYESIKCKAEGLVKKWAAQHNYKTTIYRPSIIVGDSKTGQNHSNYGPYGILRIVDLSIRRFKLEHKKGNSILKDSGARFKDSKFFIPLRVIGKRNKSLNLVNIDYVLEAMFFIFKSKDNIGKTYHITNPHPPTVGLLKDCLCEILGVKGIRFVSPKDFDKEPMKPWEQLFNKNIEIYTPYLLFDEAKFDDTNTQRVLKNTEVEQAILDKPLILKLLAYSHSTNYGKKK